MITANKFMRANYGAVLRSFLTNRVNLEKLIDFGALPVFGDATTYPIIILSSQGRRNDTPIEYALITTLNFESLPAAIQSAASKMPESAFSGTNWSLVASLVQLIFNNLKSNSIPVVEYAGSKLHQGNLLEFSVSVMYISTTRNNIFRDDINVYF